VGVVTAHVILKGAELMLCAERAKDAPDAVYGAECLTCREQSAWFEDDPKPVQVWALDHTERQGLTHNQFSVTALNHWRVDPRHAPVGAAPWPPLTRSPAAPETPPPRRSGAAHAKPRGRWLGRRLATVAGHAAGFLVLLVALVVGALLCAALPATGRGQVGAARDYSDFRVRALSVKSLHVRENRPLRGKV
jgi:hypothetical protein